ncbi:MAG: 2-oxoglutarate dehydrogenase, E2 component, dihydrolipoamide succinyltransferase, partial [Candidatus Eisenbacteria bacterium]|nr:2-oxoglutarate dehydrogenase, E2 component, dihydrolipoamide succinyltransferase [Candidatus Latescibacterota bacterium]MBD3301435.1 2-oxoglutarate dehydrogenase, E2 component, dihydrolipoamide succinyltransferase [Candidatus Eisenbacteria bacterium]
AYIESRGEEQAPAAPKKKADSAEPAGGPSERPEQPFAGAPIDPQEVRTTDDGKVEVIPMDHIRKKIAEHMVRSKATSPHVASIGEAEMTRIVRHREANKEAFQRREGFKLTYTAYITQAVVRTLKEFPYVNASIEESNILIKRFVNMGIAVAVDYGLIVPVVRQADTLNFLGLARAINDLATRARAKNLKPEEVSGGTFSITNMGTIGTLFGVPIIAQPQVGILGIGTIQKRPVVRDDAIAIRHMMYLCLSYDHRLIDGAMGGSFVQRVVHHLETMELE